MRRLLPLALLALTLSGCSQLAAIAPVGGERMSQVRYAALDLLIREDVDLLVAPVCEMADDREVTCAGTTLSGGTIEVVSSSTDQASLTVTVDESVLYSGSIQDVLDAALEPAS